MGKVKTARKPSYYHIIKAKLPVNQWFALEVPLVNDASTQERIAIVDLADDLQVRKQRIFKILPRLDIRPT